MNQAVQIMIEQINKRGYLHGNRSLHVEVVDTICSGGQGTAKAALELTGDVNDRPFGIVGCGCSGIPLGLSRLSRV